MRAARIHEFGGPEFIRVDDDVPDPQAGPGQVVIDMTAAVRGHMESDAMRGTSRSDIAFPHIMGYEAIGRIAQVGPGVRHWSVGDRVLPSIVTSCGVCVFCRTDRDSICSRAELLGSALAEQVLCSASNLTAIDLDLPDEDVIAIPTAFGTAWHMLFTRARLRLGETVLINSVGSGIGSAAVQLASLVGARIIGTASSDEKLAQAETLGMHVGINYSRARVPEEVRRATNGRGVDVVFEHVGGEHFQNGLESLAVDGRLVTCGAHAGEVVDFDIIPFFRGHHAILGSYGYSKVEAAQCLELASRGQIKAVVHRVFRLSETAEALRTMERREQFGRIVLVP